MIEMADISDKALPIVPNHYLYNGKILNEGEFSNGSGLEWYSYGFRDYDPQLGAVSSASKLIKGGILNGVQVFAKGVQRASGISKFSTQLIKSGLFMGKGLKLTNITSKTYRLVALIGGFKVAEGVGDSPIFDQNGNLLGPDNQGLQGKAIVMNKLDFGIGMSHAESLEKGLGLTGLKSKKAKQKFTITYQALSDRPDYDGYLTFFEAINWYNGGSGISLFVDASKINFLGINLNDVSASKNGFVNTYNNTPLNTGGVYGHIKFTILNEKNGKVRLGLDGNLLDVYNYPQGSFKGKVADWLNFGAPKEFNIFCYKCITTIAN